MSGRRWQPARGLALATTNLTKLAGLAIAVNEALLRSELRPTALAVAAFMMAGAQVSEGVLLAMVDRFFGLGDVAPPAETRDDGT